MVIKYNYILTLNAAKHILLSLDLMNAYVDAFIF